MMDDKYLPNLSLNPADQGDILITKSFANYMLQSLNQGEFPLLPNGFVDYKFTEAKYPIEIKGKKVSAKLPKVNEILTAYCNECLQTYFTIEFIKLVNEQDFVPDILSFKNAKLEYAIGLYNIIYGLPITSTSARNTLSYYLDDTFNIFELNSNPESKLAKLRDSLKSIETKYIEKLINEVLPNTVYVDNKPLDIASVTWFNSQKSGKVLDQTSAGWFIDRANSEMEIDIKVHFAETQIKARMFSNQIFSDPRLRMSIEDPRWHEYDETIKKEVNFYNQKFMGIGGFVPLDWRYVKAMIWTEVLAGPDNAAWKLKPMQIGVPGDPGIDVVKNGTENSDLITTEELRKQIQGNITGENNVKAGIAYLFTIAIRNSPNQRDRVGFREVVDDQTIQSHTVVRGETAETIAKKFKTTINNIIKNTNGLTIQNIGSLKPGQEIKFQKTHIESYIISWRDWKSTIRSFNGNAVRGVDKNGKSIVTGKGDPDYLEKLERAYQIIITRQK